MPSLSDVSIHRFHHHHTLCLTPVLEDWWLHVLYILISCRTYIPSSTPQRGRAIEGRTMDRSRVGVVSLCVIFQKTLLWLWVWWLWLLSLRLWLLWLRLLLFLLLWLFFTLFISTEWRGTTVKHCAIFLLQINTYHRCIIYICLCTSSTKVHQKLGRARKTSLGDRAGTIGATIDLWLSITFWCHCPPATIVDAEGSTVTTPLGFRSFCGRFALGWNFVRPYTSIHCLLAQWIPRPHHVPVRSKSRRVEPVSRLSDCCFLGAVRFNES